MYVTFGCLHLINLYTGDIGNWKYVS